MLQPTSEGPWKVLVVEDSKADFALMEAALKATVDCHVTWASDAEAALRELIDGGHDAALVDYRIPGATGPSILAKASEAGVRTPPVIIFTGQDDEEADRASLDAGAIDFLVKGAFEPKALARRIRYAVYCDRVQRAARERAERFLSLADAAQDAIVEVDEDGCVLYASPAAGRMFDWPMEELEGAGVDRLFAPGARVEGARTLQQVTAGETVGGGHNASARFETVGVRRDGKEFPVEIAVGVRDSRNGVRAIGIVRDISARVRREAELRRLAGVVKHASAAIVTEDMDGRIRLWNLAAEQVFGYGASEVVGRPMESLVSPEKAGSMRELLARTRAGQVTHHAEATILAKDGGRVEVELSAFPTRDAEGRIVATSTIVRDVGGNRRAMEAAQQRRRDESVGERSRKFDQVKNRFINSAAHELYTPLTPLVVHAKLLRDRMANDPSGMESVEAMERNLRRIQGIIRELLEVVRLEEMTRPQNREPLDLSDAAREVLRDLGQVAAIARVTLDSSLADGLDVVGERQRLAHAIHHVVHNAIRFTPAGGRVEVRSDKVGDGVWLRIQDTGPGVGAEERERIFEPFVRGEAVSGEAPGWGMGLFVARQIVERHGGSLTVEARGARPGASFVIRLPPAPKGSRREVYHGGPPPSKAR